MHCFKGLRRRLEREEERNYIKNGGAVLQEFLALCDSNCRIPIRYFSAEEINKATQHSENEKVDTNCFMVTGLLDKRLVIIRLVPNDIPANEWDNFIYRDIAITAQMSHLKNVLKLVGCCPEFEYPVMVYEYVESVTLHKLLFGSIHGQSLSWGSRLRIANDIASAVVFLHTEFKTPIIHRNLKPSNVMIDQNSRVAKLFDFSVSISLPPGELQVEELVCGTFGYIDPEYMRSGIITQKTDVYSFGVVLLALLTGRNVHNMGERRDVSCKEDSSISKSEDENGNTRDYEEEQLPSNYEELPNIEQVYSANIEGWNVMDIVDPAILEEYGTAIKQQLQDYFELVNKCRSPKGENRPYMIDVARELRRIHNCFCAFSPPRD